MAVAQVPIPPLGHRQRAFFGWPHVSLVWGFRAVFQRVSGGFLRFPTLVSWLERESGRLSKEPTTVGNFSCELVSRQLGFSISSGKAFV